MMKTRIGSFTMNKLLLDTLPPWPWTVRYNSWLRNHEVLDAEDSIVFSADDPAVALLASLGPELLDALSYCECELTLYQGLAEQSENPQAWYDAIARARTVMNKLRGKEEEQPTLF
jgi:hypothetical protein